MIFCLTGECWISKLKLFTYMIHGHKFEKICDFVCLFLGLTYYFWADTITLELNKPYSIKLYMTHTFFLCVFFFAKYLFSLLNVNLSLTYISLSKPLSGQKDAKRYVDPNTQTLSLSLRTLCISHRWGLQKISQA